MDIEKYYTVLAMGWIGWLLVLIIQCVWFEALHDKVMVKSRCVWDTDDEWVLKDRKGKKFNLASEGMLGKAHNSEITLILLMPFLVPIFTTYRFIRNENLNLWLGLILSILLFVSIPYIYNLVSALSFSLNSSGLFIGFN